MQKNSSGKTAGFTMVEILTTIGIFLILGGLTLPIGLNFYQSQKLNTFSHLFADRVEKARTFAKNGKHDSRWGVYVASSSYTLFKGSSFADRDQGFDRVYEIPDGINLSQKEVVFEKLSGRSNEAVSFDISSSARSNVVSISSIGRVRLSLDVSLEVD